MGTKGLQVKISLIDISPPIWRRLIVPVETSLLEFHELIQAAFGWKNYHLYSFEVDQTTFDLDEDHMPDPAQLQQPIGDLLPDSGNTIYNYDFGDNWRHKIVVEETVSIGDTADAIKDRSHERHAELVDWIGGDFDPEVFNPKEFNENLLLIRTLTDL